jgi:hypothetical protein
MKFIRILRRYWIIIGLLSILTSASTLNVFAIEISTTEISENSIALQWTKTVDIDFLQYRIWRSSIDSDGNYTNWNIIKTIDNPNTLTYKDENLPSNTRYAYKIDVMDKFGSVTEKSQIITPETLKEEMSGLIWVGIGAVLVGILLLYLRLGGKVKITIGRHQIEIVGKLGAALIILGFIFMAIGVGGFPL